MSWLGRATPLPAGVAVALEALLGAQMHRVRVVENSLFARLHGRALATTRRGSIYLRCTAAEFFEDPWLMLHEYWHVLGQWEPRKLTIRRYLAECLRHGYWNNRFEVEARAFADAHVHQFRALLAGGSRSHPGHLAAPLIPAAPVTPAALPADKAGRR